MTRARILLTGASGMLGVDLQSALQGRELTALSRSQLDITDPIAVADAVTGHDVVINTAAFTRVDDAESEQVEALRVNALGAETLARAAARAGSVLVQLSTDHVFDGMAASPYAEDAPLSPASAYGRTKAEGERRARAAHPDGTIIVRTAWLYGEHGPNFAATMLALADQRETLNVVDDQRGQPTWTLDLAERIVALIDGGTRSGNFHGTSSGETTWFGFARAVFAEAGLDPNRVLPTATESFPRPARRPPYSVLGHTGWSAVGLPPMRGWRESLSAAWASGALTPRHA